MTRGHLAASGLLGILLTATPANADEETRALADALTIQGDGRCLERESLGAQVAKWLGRSAIDARVAIMVTEEEEPAPALSFVVQRDGETVAIRRFERPPTSCDDVRAVAALAIALAIDATVLSKASSASPPPPPPPPGPPPQPIDRPDKIPSAHQPTS